MQLSKQASKVANYAYTADYDFPRILVVRKEWRKGWSKKFLQNRWKSVIYKFKVYKNTSLGFFLYRQKFYGF